jgi:hypothetical protein
MGRFINADAFASTGQGLLGNNLFTYCQNTPINYIDPYGTAFMPIGAGFQFEIDAGNGTVGIEIIVYWDVEECSNGGLVIAVYTYGGLSVPCNDPYLGSILAVITDNSQILSEGNEEAIIAIATLLSDTFDIAVSGVLITGNEDFINTESYNGSFTSIGGNLGKLKGSVAYSENCIGYALGYNVVGSIFSAGWGISKTIYTQIYEFRLFGEADNIPKHGGLGGKF